MPLTVTNVNPDYCLYTGGDQVVITGTNFTQTVRVKFGGVTAKTVVRNSATQLTVTVPAQTVGGAVAVTVTNDPGLFVDGGPTVPWGNQFHYLAKITSIDPPQAPTTGGTDLTITGTGFPLNPEVEIDGMVPANIVRASATRITCRDVQHDLGDCDVFVFHAGATRVASTRISYVAPMVTSVRPKKATTAGNSSITVCGKHFNATTTVNIAGAPAAVTARNLPGELTVTTPAHVAGAVAVEVINPIRALVPAAGPNPIIPAVAASQSQLAGAFEYSAAEVTSIEPAKGPAAGGTDVTIRGRGFLALQVNGVLIGGVAATHVNRVDESTITARTAAVAAGAGDVSVQNNNGEPAVVLAAAFTFVGVPTVTKVDPPQGPASTPITITGTGFVAGAKVHFDGVEATGVKIVSATAITATAPAHGLGQVDVTVTNEGGTAGTMGNGYTYTGLSVEPARGVAAGGEQVTLRIPGAVRDDTVVTLDGTQAVRVGGGGFAVTTPPHGVGAVDVVVDGTTLANGFTYSTVTKVVPDAGPAGTTVVIHGAGFDGTSTVQMGGADAVITNVAADQLTVTSPVHVDGPVDVVVAVAGAGTFANSYTYQPAATVTAIAPAVGTHQGGTEVTITGTGFVKDAAVQIDGNDCTDIVVVSATTITAKTPTIVAAAPYAAVDVQVRNPGAAADAVGLTLFTYRGEPTVTAVAAPATGHTDGGRTITLTGTDFVDGAKVVIAGAEVPGVEFVNGTTLRVRVPAHGLGQVGVAVHNPEDPNPGPTRANTFQYVADRFTATGDNHVRFIRDGEDYFEDLRLQFEWVRQAAVDPKGLTYVRLAFWMICDDVTLGDRTYFEEPNHTLLNYIEMVVRAGHHVEVIMWRPKKIEQTNGEGEGVYKANRVFADKMYALDVAMAGVEGAGRARVYFESYEGEIGASNHQKMAIFSVAGQRHVIIGGINLSNSYFSSNDHQFPDPANAWHDAAMYIEGPITDDIEKEWMRRWDRTRALENGWFANAFGANGEFLSRDFAFNKRSTVRRREIVTEKNTTIQAPHADNREVFIALTRSTSNGVTTTRHTWLRDKVIERIDAADNYIYFENYHFSDPDVVRAVYTRHRIRQLAGHDLRVAIVVPLQMSNTSSYMTRRAWLQCILRFVNGATNTPYCTSVVYDIGGGPQTVVRATCGANWHVHDCYDPDHPLATKWLEGDTLRFTSGANPEVTVPFHQILAVEGDLHFYAPVFWTGANTESVYPHSKVAAFDDQWFVVGSSNWSFRSMQYDGEISAFVNHGGTTAAAVQGLLDHFNTGIAPTTPAALEAAAMNYINAGAVGNTFCLFPLDVYDNGNPLGPNNPLFAFSSAVPPALEYGTIRDFLANPTEPNYTWL